MIQFKKHKKAWTKFLEYSARSRPYAALNIDDYISSFSIQSMIGWYILFFEENGIIISISIYPHDKINFKYKYDYNIKFKNNLRIITSKDFETRPECWMDMINEAFKILEKTL